MSPSKSEMEEIQQARNYAGLGTSAQLSTLRWR